MPKRKPYKQKWDDRKPPTDEEIESGRRGFEPTTLTNVELLAAHAKLFPLFCGARTKGASTAPRCYLFYSKNSFEQKNENLGCIDGSHNARLIVRPFGRGKNRVHLLPSKWKSRFQTSDLPDWRHMFLKNMDDWETASLIMIEI